MAGERRPTLAAILTGIGGVFVVVGGLVLWRIGTVLATVFGLSSPWYSVGVVVGVVATLAGIAMGLLPRARRGLGALALGLAVASLPLAFGGLAVGFALTAVGGAIALARPQRPVAVGTFPAPSGRPPPWT